MNKLKLLIGILFLQGIGCANAQSYTYLRPERVFDGEKMLEKQGVLIKDKRIESIGSQLIIEKSLPKDTKIVDFKNCTLLPGLIEGHTHLFLHPL